MALKITHTKGIFLVEGVINAVTALNFKSHIEALIKSIDDLVINIEKVTEIDTNGMKALRSIYESSMAYDKNFYVVGLGCKEVYDDLYMNSAA